MWAPRRASSCTCMKRFSKIVSVIRDLPLAIVISPMNCACRSVGKPGNGSVVTSTGAMPAPLRLTRMPELIGVISGAGAARSRRARSAAGPAWRLRAVTSPPVIATAIA